MQNRTLSLKNFFLCGCVVLIVLFAAFAFLLFRQTAETRAGSDAAREVNNLADLIYRARMAVIQEREAGLAAIAAGLTPVNVREFEPSKEKTDAALKPIFGKKEALTTSAGPAIKNLEDKYLAFKKQRQLITDRVPSATTWQNGADEFISACAALGRSAFDPDSFADLARLAQNIRDDISETDSNLRRLIPSLTSLLREGKRLSLQQEEDLRHLVAEFNKSSYPLVNLSNLPDTSLLFTLSPSFTANLATFRTSHQQVKNHLTTFTEAALKGQPGATVEHTLTADSLKRDAQATINSLGPLANDATTLGQKALDEASSGADLAGMFNIAIAIAALLTLAALLYYLQTRIVAKLTALTDVAIRIEKGDEKVRAPEYAADEIGVLAATFNRMLDVRHKSRVAAEADYRTLQEGVQTLLKITREVSRGDLSVRIPPAQGALGQISEAINGMLKTFTQIILDVQVLAGRVATAAKDIKASSENLNKGSLDQTREIERTNEAIAKMATQGHQIAKNSEDTSVSADKTRSEAEEGSRTVVQVMDGMERVRFNVQSGAKKIKRLGERSMEISTIVNTISDISSQTDMLALNAALDAARADQADTGFSDAVRRLSERVAAATAEIGELISGMQADTNESVASMETQTTEVEQESRMVYTAGESLKRIRDSALSSASLTKQINEAAKAQVEETDDVIKAMQVLYQIAAHTQKEAEQTKNSSDSLFILAGYLSDHTSQYRLSDTAAPNAPSAPRFTQPAQKT